MMLTINVECVAVGSGSGREMQSNAEPVIFVELTAFSSYCQIVFVSVIKKIARHHV